MRAHTDEKPFECPTYNMRFTWKEPLETHEKTHEWARIDEKPFECPTCNMRFTGKEQHETHEKAHERGHWRAHTGEKPHPCEQCKTSSISASMFKSICYICLNMIVWSFIIHTIRLVFKTMTLNLVNSPGLVHILWVTKKCTKSSDDCTTFGI